jgi:hypothetical protein
MRPGAEFRPKKPGEFFRFPPYFRIQGSMVGVRIIRFSGFEVRWIIFPAQAPPSTAFGRTDFYFRATGGWNSVSANQ